VLSFRQLASSDDNLRTLLADIADLRTGSPQKELTSIRALRTLIDSARSLDNGEYLAYAAVWLRYVLLLSYRGQGNVVVAKNSRNSIDRQWIEHKLPQSSFLLPQQNVRRSHSFLRWSGMPP